MNGVGLMRRIKDYNASIMCILVSGQDSLEVVVDSYKSGAQDYIIKNDNLFVNLENSVKNLSMNVVLKKENEMLKDQIIDRHKYSNIMGSSNAVLRILRLIQKVEKSNMMVLVTGQSGTGKELVARALHYNSPRARKNFVTVNMSAIPEELIESELFGHEGSIY